jgi:hypothetical protein
MYEVGQVLYTIIDDKQVVIPVKIIEQVTVKTLEGEETNYKLLLPNNKMQKVDMIKFKNLYPDVDAIEKSLTEKAKNAITQMLVDAVTLEDRFFAQNVKKDIKNIELSPMCNNENQNVKIDLGDGVVANIDKNNINKIIEQEELQKKT